MKLFLVDVHEENYLSILSSPRMFWKVACGKISDLWKKKLRAAAKV